MNNFAYHIAKLHQYDISLAAYFPVSAHSEVIIPLKLASYMYMRIIHCVLEISLVCYCNK